MTSTPPGTKKIRTPALNTGFCDNLGLKCSAQTVCFHFVFFLRFLFRFDILGFAKFFQIM